MSVGSPTPGAGMALAKTTDMGSADVNLSSNATVELSAAKLLRTARSMLVGGVSTVVDLVVLATLVSLFGAPLRLASPIALGLGIVCQFVGNKLFAFHDRRPRWATQAALFLAVEALGFITNLIVFDVAVRALPIPYLVTRVLTQSFVYFAICLPLWARIFTPAKESSS